MTKYSVSRATQTSTNGNWFIVFVWFVVNIGVLSGRYDLHRHTPPDLRAVM
ncbi:MAG: hypothetical protein FWD36_07185 [Treponema sp.]|nr:hypothetical protein [Treponema sp.]